MSALELDDWDLEGVEEEVFEQSNETDGAYTFYASWREEKRKKRCPDVLPASSKQFSPVSRTNV